MARTYNGTNQQALSYLEENSTNSVHAVRQNLSTLAGANLEVHEFSGLQKTSAATETCEISNQECERNPYFPGHRLYTPGNPYSPSYHPYDPSYVIPDITIGSTGPSEDLEEKRKWVVFGKKKDQLPKTSKHKFMEHCHENDADNQAGLEKRKRQERLKIRERKIAEQYMSEQQISELQVREQELRSGSPSSRSRPKTPDRITWKQIKDTAKQLSPKLATKLRDPFVVMKQSRQRKKSETVEAERQAAKAHLDAVSWGQSRTCNGDSMGLLERRRKEIKPLISKPIDHGQVFIADKFERRKPQTQSSSRTGGSHKYSQSNVSNGVRMVENGSNPGIYNDIATRDAFLPSPSFPRSSTVRQQHIRLPSKLADAATGQRNRSVENDMDFKCIGTHPVCLFCGQYGAMQGSELCHGCSLSSSKARSDKLHTRDARNTQLRDLLAQIYKKENSLEKVNTSSRTLLKPSSPYSDAGNPFYEKLNGEVTMGPDICSQGKNIATATHIDRSLRYCEFEEPMRLEQGETAPTDWEQKRNTDFYGFYEDILSDSSPNADKSELCRNFR